MQFSTYYKITMADTTTRYTTIFANEVDIPLILPQHHMAIIPSYLELHGKLPTMTQRFQLDGLLIDYSHEDYQWQGKQEAKCC
jgi:hypothetical protein